MKKTTFFLIAVALFSACETYTKEDTIDEASMVNDARKIDSTSDIAGCYRGVLERDTVYFVMQHDSAAKSVNGDLTFINFQKDSRKGTFAGKLTDSLISGYYSYQSEGQRTVEQRVFKLQNNELLQGYGDVSNRNDTIVFKDVNRLNYLTNMPLVKVACEDIP